MRLTDIDNMPVTAAQCDRVEETVSKLVREQYDSVTPEEFWVFLHFYEIHDFFGDEELETQLLKRYGVEK